MSFSRGVRQAANKVQDVLKKTIPSSQSEASQLNMTNENVAVPAVLRLCGSVENPLDNRVSNEEMRNWHFFASLNDGSRIEIGSNLNELTRLMSDRAIIDQNQYKSFGFDFVGESMDRKDVVTELSGIMNQLKSVGLVIIPRSRVRSFIAAAQNDFSLFLKTAAGAALLSAGAVDLASMAVRRQLRSLVLRTLTAFCTRAGVTVAYAEVASCVLSGGMLLMGLYLTVKFGVQFYQAYQAHLRDIAERENVLSLVHELEKGNQSRLFVAESVVLHAPEVESVDFIPLQDGVNNYTVLKLTPMTLNDLALERALPEPVGSSVEPSVSNENTPLLAAAAEAEQAFVPQQDVMSSSLSSEASAVQPLSASVMQLPGQMISSWIDMGRSAFGKQALHPPLPVVRKELTGSFQTEESVEIPGIPLPPVSKDYLAQTSPFTPFYSPQVPADHHTANNVNAARPTAVRTADETPKQDLLSVPRATFSPVRPSRQTSSHAAGTNSEMGGVVTETSYLLNTQDLNELRANLPVANHSMPQLPVEATSPDAFSRHAPRGLIDRSFSVCSLQELLHDESNGTLRISTEEAHNVLEAKGWSILKAANSLLSAKESLNNSVYSKGTALQLSPAAESLEKQQ